MIVKDKNTLTFIGKQGASIEGETGRRLAEGVYQCSVKIFFVEDEPKLRLINNIQKKLSGPVRCNISMKRKEREGMLRIAKKIIYSSLRHCAIPCAAQVNL